MRLQLMKTRHISAQIHKTQPLSPSQTQTISTPKPSTILKLSRRDLAICILSSSPVTLFGSHIVDPFHISEAQAEEVSSETNSCTGETLTKRAFLDVSIDGEPAGRIIIGLYGVDAPSGTARFSNLVSGAKGVSYRRKEFTKITPNYVQHGGVRSYGVDAELAKQTGENLAVDSLVEELERLNEKCPGTKNKAASVSIIVRDPLKPPPKLKLVARQGKLEIDEEEVGTSPNGTEFVISTKDSPELDASSLVVGKVLDGMDVVEKIAQVKTVQENSTSPYFRVAKLIGDKRAVVAERGFNRPYSKVLITKCGLID
ncbi:hypothetical protein AQUCO_02600222v1 [Aquilegia coerulea]|uniref:PPIase cyclophilin-type domain-containing protein n=1 Tax=Aquilegia coerulea TaxID=218851 RepID=A0A2G5D7X7_AQUCA|nr:hypothetical protein AQUCO_02600222v1 [Aquilegia coerulea]